MGLSYRLVNIVAGIIFSSAVLLAGEFPAALALLALLGCAACILE